MYECLEAIPYTKGGCSEYLQAAGSAEALCVFGFCDASTCSPNHNSPIFGGMQCLGQALSTLFECAGSFESCSGESLEDVQNGPASVDAAKVCPCLEGGGLLLSDCFKLFYSVSIFSFN